MGEQLQGVGEQKVGAVAGEWGNNYPQNPFYPHLFPRFSLAVNASPCTLLQRKLLIPQ